jgi:hypothetical protein
MIDMLMLFFGWCFVAITIVGVPALILGFIACVISDAINARGNNVRSKHRII